MDPHYPPWFQPQPESEDESAPPSNPADNLELPQDMIAEIDTVLQTNPTPTPLTPVPTLTDPLTIPPGRRVTLLRETQWTVTMAPWRELMLYPPLREPVNNRIINIQDSVNLKSFLDQRIRKRHAMLYQAVGVKADPPCKQCAQGKGQFVGCIHIPGLSEVDGPCANCLWEKSASQRGQCSFFVERQRQRDAEEYEERMRTVGEMQTFNNVWKLPKN